MQLMLIHSSTPWTRGRMPTLRSVSRVSDAPIKKSERVMRCLASLFTALLNSPPADAAPSPMGEALLNIYVLKIIATINQMINRGTQLYQGFDSPPALASELRKKKGVTNAKTTIHKARVSLMVVATSRVYTKQDAAELFKCAATRYV